MFTWLGVFATNFALASIRSGQMTTNTTLTPLAKCNSLDCLSGYHTLSSRLFCILSMLFGLEYSQNRSWQNHILIYNIFCQNLHDTAPADKKTPSVCKYLNKWIRVLKLYNAFAFVSYDEIRLTRSWHVCLYLGYIQFLKRNASWSASSNSYIGIKSDRQKLREENEKHSHANEFS